MFYRVNTEDYDYGMIDWHGNVVLPAQYTSIDASGDGLYVLADVDYETQELYEVTAARDQWRRSGRRLHRGGRPRPGRGFRRS